MHESMRSLHVVGSVQHRVHFKILILTFKAIHGLAPKYIIELINIKPRSIYNLRSNQSLLLDPPKGKMLVTLGDRSFSAAAPYLWKVCQLNYVIFNY